MTNTFPYPLLEAGYGFQEPTAGDRQETKGGLARSRADLDTASFILSLQCKLVGSNFDGFVSFFVANKSVPFFIPLFVNTLDFVTHTANFTSDGWKLVKQQGLNFTVAFQLEVQPQAINTSADNAIVAAWNAAHP